MSSSIEKVPTWSLSYCINDDATGLTDEEINIIDTLFREQQIQSICPIEEDEETGAHPYFTSVPWFGLPTEVEDCIVTYNI